MAEEEKKEQVKTEEKQAEAQAEEKPAAAEAGQAEEAKEEKAAEAPKEEAKAEEVKEEKPAAAEAGPAEAPKKEEAKAKEEKPATAKAGQAAAPKAEAPKVQEPAVELSKEAQKIVETLKNMSVLELSQLVKELESVFGVSAAAPVAAAGGPAAGAPGAEGGEEKTSFDVVLSAAGNKKIQVIKEVRTITGLGLKEAKDLVDGAPKPVKQGVNKEEADKIKGQLEGAGATVEVK